jgi:hypothetical protein
MKRRRHEIACEPIAVGQEEAATLFRISVGLFLQLVREGVFHQPTYLHSLPRWDVHKLLVEWCRHMGENQEADDGVWDKIA